MCGAATTNNIPIISLTCCGGGRCAAEEPKAAVQQIRNTHAQTKMHTCTQTEMHPAFKPKPKPLSLPVAAQTACAAVEGVCER